MAGQTGESIFWNTKSSWLWLESSRRKSRAKLLWRISSDEQNNLGILPDASESTDSTSSDSEVENERICLSHSNDEKEKKKRTVLVVTMPL